MYSSRKVEEGELRKLWALNLKGDNVWRERDLASRLSFIGVVGVDELLGIIAWVQHSQLRIA